MPFITNCPECPYGGRAIGPRGDPASQIALVGEAPGDDRGRAGKTILWTGSFEPLTERDLLGLERFRMAVRTELAGQATVFTADILPEPERFGQADLVRRLSDERDGHDPF